MTPLATYIEQRFDGKRTFELFEDKVSIYGSRTLQTDFQMTVPLASLNPDYGRLWIRHASFFFGLWLMVGSWVLAAIVRTIIARDLNEVVFFLNFMGLAGLLLSLTTVRKIEWVSFTTDAGITGLDIARAGKETDKFETFVDTLASQIRVVRSRTVVNA